MIGRERLGIALGLAGRALHRAGPLAGAALGHAAFEAFGGGLTEEIAQRVALAAFHCGNICRAALLGFENEAVALVAIDPAVRRAAVDLRLDDVAFEDIVVLLRVADSGMWRVDAEQDAQIGNEQLSIGTLVAA